MTFIRTPIKKIFAVAVMLSLLAAAVIIPLDTSAGSSVPSKMLDNVFLDALEYAGYDVQAQISDGTIYRSYGSGGTPDSVATNIPYSLSGIASGYETTSSGKPDIDYFEKYGLCCGSYVSYVYYNYLPNVAGTDTSSLSSTYGGSSVISWENAITSWVNNGTGTKVSFTQNSDGSLSTDWDIPIGSVVIFKSSEYRYAHVAIYAGCYNGTHFITHCGGDRGPCIQSIEALYLYADQSVKMIVSPSLYDNMSLNKSSITLGKGESYTLKASGGSAASWSSSDMSVVTVSDSGKLTAKGTGTATVTVVGEYGSAASCKVTVKNAPSSVSLNKTKLTMGIGETYDLNSSLPKGTASYSIKYTSDKSSVASVASSGGLVTAKKTGTAVITAACFNGKKVTCTVTVKEAPKSMKLNKTKITLGIGETYDLNSSLPEGTAAHSIKYSSDKSSVASVVSAGGLVTAKKAGTAVITATAYNGVTAKCTIVVKEEPTDIFLNGTELSLTEGEQFDLNSSVPSGTAAYHIYYSSDNSGVAKVEKCGGLVTAVQKGTAVITAEAYNGLTVSCKVTVG